MDAYLNYLKEEYKKTEATRHLRNSGWDELARRIGLFDVPKQNLWFRNFAVAFAVLLIFLAGTYQIAQASVPGNPLYPIKILSEKVIQSTSGSNQIVIDHRAKEIVDLTKQQDVNSDSLKQAVSDYKENVEQAKQQIQITGKPSIRFDQKLEEQHSEFDKISHDNPEIEDEIKDARDASEHEGGSGGD